MSIQNKWLILTPSTAGRYGRAVSRISAAIAAAAGYAVPVFDAAAPLDDALLAENSLVILGTADSPLLARFVGEGLIAPPTGRFAEQGYSIRVCDSAWSAERQMALILGGSEIGALYGAVEFVARYAGDDAFDHARHEVTCHRYFETTFRQKMPEFAVSSSPAFARRAIWTWGHCIYNYRAFLEHMLSMKLDQLVIWNDHVPVNAAEVVDYAHRRGIEIIWGFSWGWGLDCRNPGFAIDDEGVIDEWAERIYATYTRDYAPTGADGIYFQSFTETKEEQIDGVYISQAVVKWVNRIGGRLLETYPDLHIQFGLHASSVDRRLDDIAGVDPRIRIVWEDCGAFPYHYNPRLVDSFDETMAFNDRICRLRGEGERFGAVLKGQVKLDWTRFAHQPGHFVLGEADPIWLDERRRSKERIWRVVQGDWLENAPYAQRLIARTRELTAGEASMQMLVEDGCIEERIFYPTALCAALLWDPDAELSRLMGQVARDPQVRFSNL